MIIPSMHMHVRFLYNQKFEKFALIPDIFSIKSNGFIWNKSPPPPSCYAVTNLGLTTKAKVCYI